MNSSATVRMASNTAVLPQQLSWEQAIARLQGDDLQDRYYAAWYLGTVRDPRGVEPLLLALQDERDRTALGGLSSAPQCR